jgi:gentisate 1,2-dioxygenase
MVIAIRLVMSGTGAETITEGKVCPMEPGDLILTPAWTWHEHHHRGTERMVWFDGLDLPLARQLGTIFFEPEPGPVAPCGLVALSDDALQTAGVLPDGDDPTRTYSPLFRYPWERVQRTLDAMPASGQGIKRLRYVNPADGGPVLPTIDCYALRLDQGAVTPRQRSTETAIVVVIEGEGETIVGDTRITWSPHDVFTLPRWQWVEHRASAAPATLFLMTDRALIERLGYFREEVAA